MEKVITEENLDQFTQMDVDQDYRYQLDIAGKTYYVPVDYEVDLKEVCIKDDSPDPLQEPTRIGIAWYPVFQKLSRSANWLFWSLIDQMNKENNIAHYRAKNKTEANKISRAYKELNEKDMVKRIKPEHYFINPTAIIPAHTYDQVLEHWYSI